MATDIKRIDPRGCGCTDCLIGYSKPLGFADGTELFLMLQGAIQNATGYEADHFQVDHIDISISIRQPDEDQEN